MHISENITANCIDNHCINNHKNYIIQESVIRTYHTQHNKTQMVSGCNEVIICFWRKYQLFVFFSNQKISVIVLFQQFRYNWKNSFPEIKSESIGKNSVSSKWKHIVVSSKSEKQIFFSRNSNQNCFPALPPASIPLSAILLIIGKNSAFFFIFFATEM